MIFLKVEKLFVGLQCADIANAPVQNRAQESILTLTKEYDLHWFVSYNIQMNYHPYAKIN